MRITTVEFIRDPAAVSAHARMEPVTVTEGDRDEFVVLSAAEYARLKAKDVRRVEVSLFGEEEIALLEAGEMSAEHAHLDSLLREAAPSE